VLEVSDHGSLLPFSFADMLRYAGPGSPAGVAMAYQAMTTAFSHLDPETAPERREIRIETAFRGPGARDGFELVTRAVTEGRYLVTATLEHPERGVTLEQFVFRFLYRGRACTLLVREAMVSEEFVTMARKSDRTPEDERHFAELKQRHADRLLASAPGDIFEVG
jgi:hypothetical protein